jgi:uncharacterized protein with LGFP repeats
VPGGPGLENSALGFPTSEEIAVKGGVVQRFQNGLYCWTAATGAHEVRGAILSRCAALGGENSALGFPVSQARVVAGGVRQDFQRGSLSWNARTGAVS